MKRVLGLLILILLILTGLSGCSDNRKTVEALRLEVKEELEAEKALKEEIKEELKAELAIGQGNKNSGLPNGSIIDSASTGQVLQNDYTKGYTCKVEGGSLKITYSESGITETLISTNKVYDFIKEGGIGQNKFTVLHAGKSFNGEKIYFTVEAPDYAINPVTYYMLLQSREIFLIHSGEFVRDIADYPYADHVILKTGYDKNVYYNLYNSTGKLICELGKRLEDDILAQIKRFKEAQSSAAGVKKDVFHKLSGFKNESINNGDYMEYNKYCAVILPMYDGVNKSLLTHTPKVMGSTTKSSISVKLSFAIFGYLKNVIITYYERPNSKGEILEAGALSNSNVELEVKGWGDDTSYIRISGEAPTSSGMYSYFSFNLDGVRDLSEYGSMEFE